MEPHELNRMFERLAPTPEQEQEGLRRLLQMERKVTPMKKLKKLTVIGIAAALMVISCAAAVVTGVDQRLMKYFSAEPEDAELVAPAAVAVNQSHTYKNGWTVEIRQVLADRLFLAALVDITAPEGTVLSEGEQFSLGIDQLDSQGEPVNSDTVLMRFTRQLEDGDPTDNHMTVLWQVRKTKGEESVPYVGGSLRLTPIGVWFQQDEEMAPAMFEDSGERWSCTVKLPDTDPGTTWDMDQPLSIGKARVRLSGIYLSPLSLTIYVQDPEQNLRAPEWENPEDHQEEWEEYWEIQQMCWEDNAVLNLADGTKIAATGSQGKIAGVSYTLRFDQILDVEEIVSITLFGQTFELK